MPHPAIAPRRVAFLDSSVKDIRESRGKYDVPRRVDTGVPGTGRPVPPRRPIRIFYLLTFPEMEGVIDIGAWEPLHDASDNRLIARFRLAIAPIRRQDTACVCGRTSLRTLAGLDKTHFFGGCAWPKMTVSAAVRRPVCIGYACSCRGHMNFCMAEAGPDDPRAMYDEPTGDFSIKTVQGT